MKFCMDEWLRMYHKTHEIGRELADAMPTYSYHGSYIPPKVVTTKADRQELEMQIEYMLNKSDRYLKQCNVCDKGFLWKYDHKDKRTHKSSDKFVYADRLV